MKTTLHYQVKDFKKFVMDSLEKRGYVLAAGCEPEMSDMGDPEQVVMEVLVEDRPEIEFNQVLVTQIEPAALPAPEPMARKEEGTYRERTGPSGEA